jgi:tight adherence protein B
MSRRIASVSALVALTLLGALLVGGVAVGQPSQEPLEVDYRGQDTSPGRLQVTVAMSGPAWDPSQRLRQDSFSAWVNGNQVPIREAKPLNEQQGTRGKLAVVLVIDTSASMEGEKIVRAKAAADGFVRAMRPDDRLGLVAFSDRPQVLQNLTTDHQQIRDSISGLVATGDTALNDAIVQASGLLTNEQGQQRNLVVVSDGKDDGSKASLTQAIAAAKNANVFVDTVSLPGGEQDPQALRRLATGTGGKAFEVANANELERQLASIRQTLASQYVVDMTMPPGLGTEVAFRLQVTTPAAVGNYRNPQFQLEGQVSPATTPARPPAKLSPVPPLSKLESPQGRYVIAIAGFAAVLLTLLILFGPGSRSTRPYRALRQRLSPYSLTPAIADDHPRLTAFGSSEWAGRATAMAETLVRRGNLEEAFLDRLESAGLNMRVAEFVLISLGSAFIPPLLALVITRNLLVAGVVVILGTVAPFLYLSVRASRRQAKFEEQLPSTLQLLSGALQAGHSLQQAVDTVVHEAGDPIAGEFQRVLTEARLGRPLEEAFEAMARRTNSVDFTWTVMAIRLQRQVGGNLAEVLSTVSQTIRDRYTLKRQVKALSAEGRLSSIILSVLPVLMFVALLIFNPLFLRPLFTTSMGIMLMGGAAVLMIFGVFWLKKITEIKV